MSEEDAKMRVLKHRTWIGISYCISMRNLWLGYSFVVVLSALVLLLLYFIEGWSRFTVGCAIMIPVALVCVFFRYRYLVREYSEEEVPTKD